MLAGGRRLAQKALHDVLNLSGRAPKLSWRPGQWFVSTAGGTLPACGVEEVDRERSCLRLLGQETTGRGSARGCGAAILPPQARVDPSLRHQRRLHTPAAPPPLRWPLLPPSSGRTGPSSLFLPWFSSLISLLDNASPCRLHGLVCTMTDSQPPQKCTTQWEARCGCQEALNWGLIPSRPQCCLSSDRFHSLFELRQIISKAFTSPLTMCLWA